MNSNRPVDFDYAAADYEFIYGFLNELDIPSGRILFLHVRLKGLKNHENIVTTDYPALTSLLLDVFENLLSPTTILVPTFTYSFTDSGIFHRIFSQSEVGRFSEEVRLHFAKYRTPDPIFNIADTTDHLESTSIDYTTAFGKDSMFDYLHHDDCIIVNFDLPKLLMTQVHYIEHEFGVSYRYNKSFEGVVYSDYTEWYDIEYDYYVRDLDEDPMMDYKKRYKMLDSAGVLHHVQQDGIDAWWTTAQDKYDVLLEALSEDERVLLDE